MQVANTRMFRLVTCECQKQDGHDYQVRVRKFGWSAAGAGGFVGCARLRRGVFAPRSRRKHAPLARIPSNFEGENGMNLDWPRAREGARAELVLSGGSMCERAKKALTRIDTSRRPM